MARTRNLGNLTDLLTAGSTYVTTATPPQFDSSTNLATTAFMKNAGMFFATQNIYSTNTVLTATSAGKEITVTGACTITLPLASTCVAGTVIQICAQTDNIIVTRQGTDGIAMTPSNTSFTMNNADTLAVMSDGIGVWIAVSGTIQAKASSSFAMVSPTVNVISTGALTGTSAFTCSSSLTAPRNGWVVAHANVNFSSPGAAGSSTTGNLTINGTIVANDATTLAMTQFGIMAAVKGTLYTASYAMLNNGTSPNVSSTMHTLIHFIGG